MADTPPVTLNLLPDPSLDNAAATALQNAGLPTGTTSYPGEGTTLGSWFAQEQASAEYHGTTALAGLNVPKGDVSAFMGMIGYVETWMSNVGYDRRYMPSAVQMEQAVQAGLADNPFGLWQFFGQVTGAAQSVPGALYGMSGDQFQKQHESLTNALFETTGQMDWGAAGLDPSVMQTALQNNWSSTQLSDYIQQNTGLSQKYGYLKYGYNYNTYQQWKQQNRLQVQNLYGSNATDQQYQQALANPRQQFQSSGATVTASPTQSAVSGRQSFIR